MSKGETHAEVELLRGGSRIFTQAGESSDHWIEGPSVSSSVLTPSFLHIDHCLSAPWQMREEGPIDSGTNESCRAQDSELVLGAFLSTWATPI